MSSNSFYEVFLSLRRVTVSDGVFLNPLLDVVLCGYGIYRVFRETLDCAAVNRSRLDDGVDVGLCFSLVLGKGVGLAEAESWGGHIG